jgi:hypothetical protein
MQITSVPTSKPSAKLTALALLCAAGLSACVIVPIDPKTGQPYPYPNSAAPSVIVVPAPSSPGTVHSTAPATQAITVRLYPTNDAARAVGVVQATVSDNGQGRGSFQVQYATSWLMGDATRVDRNHPGFGEIMNRVAGRSGYTNYASGQRGVANAAGTQISLRCEYLFSAAAQGTGACMASDGAHFQLHFGS